jgi:alpha-tubulin suppressor-like RCC1 family protein
VFEAQPIQFFVDNAITVTQVSCGRAHSLCLTDDGQVYSFGKGAEGRLGHPNTNDQVRTHVLMRLSTTTTTTTTVHG